MKTIFIAIAFGTGIRDVLRNDIFNRLKDNSNLRIIIFLPELDSAIIEEFESDNVFIEKLIPYQPNFLERVLRHFTKALLRDKSSTINLGNVSGNKSVLNFFTPFARLVKLMLGDRRSLKLISAFYRYLRPDQSYQSVFEKYSPDLVILSRVLDYSLDYPIMKTAAYYKIPSICLVSSWDNLTAKGFIPLRFSSMVVWNQVMKEEAVKLFHFSEEKIFVGGIPRFDFYFSSKNEFRSKKDFFSYLNIDPSTKLITYTTGSKRLGRSKYSNITPEPLIVNDIVKAINDKAIDDVTLLIRLHPQAELSDYANILSTCNKVVLYTPGKKMGFSDRVFDTKEDHLLAETLMHSAVIINFASTITIDSAVFNTPTVCVNYDPRMKVPKKYKLTRAYDFDHYKKLIQLGKITIANSKEGLIEDINSYLANPHKDEENRRLIVEHFCQFSDGLSGRRTANHIQDILYQNTFNENERVPANTAVLVS